MDPATSTVWDGSEFAVTTVPLPQPGPLGLREDELLVKIELATICGSDLHTTSGRRSTPVPSVLGHEAVGRVVSAGPGAASMVGDRVVWTIGTACGECRRCRNGLSQKCEHVRKYGHERIDHTWWLNGTLASHVHLIAGTGVVRVPDDLPAALLAPAGCATATITAAVRRTGVTARDRVAVLGCGMLGLTAIAYAHHLGVTEVVATDVDPARRALAALLGATAIAPDQLTGRYDVLLEVSGNQAAVRSAIDSADVGGRVALVGSVAPGPATALDPEAVVRGLITIVGSHNYAHGDLVEAVTFLKSTPAADLLTGLVSDPMPLADIDAGFAAARTSTTPRVAIRHEG